MATKSNPVQDKIKAYLDKRAAEDPLFAVTYTKENKNMKECYDYIRGRAFKEASDGCAALDDEEAYSWAVHYWDEDDLKIDKLPANVRTAVSTSEAKQTEVKPETSKMKLKPKKKEDAGFITWASIEPIVDIQSSSDMIFGTLGFCDLYKIGLMSGKKYDKDTLQDFIVQICYHAAGKAKIYFKDSLLEQAHVERKELVNCVDRDYNLFKSA